METDQKEENNEVIGGMETDEIVGQQERGSDDQYQPISRPPSSRKHMRDESDSRSIDRKPSCSRSRSRSRSIRRRRQWRSANAFLNFMQDFRQNYNKVKSKDLFRLGGQTWRQMSSTEKMPYVEAAKLAQQQSQQNNKSAQQNNKSNSSESSSKKPEDPKDKKRKEREQRREKKRSRSKRNDSDSESDSATSGTGATGRSVTSEDVSDLSS